MFKKKPIPDPDDLEKFQKEAQMLQQVEDGLKTPFGKYILSLLQEYDAFAVKEFRQKDISGMGDLQLLAWCLSIRGKLQLLDNIRKQLESAKADKEILIKELKQYSA